jgi:tRNA A-37 threonylcarbamoyl transferase component Bud32
MPAPRGLARKILALFLSATLIPWQQPALLFASDGAAASASTQEEDKKEPDPETDADRSAAVDDPGDETSVEDPASWVTTVTKTVTDAYEAVSKWILDANQPDGKLAGTIEELKKKLAEQTQGETADKKTVAEAKVGIESLDSVLKIKKTQTDLEKDIEKLSEFANSPERNWDAGDWKRFDSGWKSIEDRLAQTAGLLERERGRAGLDSLSSGVLPSGFGKTHGTLIARLGSDYTALVDSAKPLLERSLQSPSSESGKTAKALMTKVRAQLGTSIGEERLALVERNLASSLGSNGGPPLDGVIDQIGDLYSQAGVTRTEMPFTLGQLKDSARTQQARTASLVQFTEAAKLWRPSRNLDRAAPGISNIPGRKADPKAPPKTEPAPGLVERAKGIAAKIPAEWRGKTLAQLEASGTAIGDLFPSGDRDALSMALDVIKTQSGVKTVSDRVGALVASLEGREKARLASSSAERFTELGKSVEAFGADLSGLLKDPAFLKDPAAADNFRGELDKLLARVAGDDSEWSKLLERSDSLASPPLTPDQLAAMKAKVASVKPLVEFLQSLKANPRLKLTAMNAEIYKEFVRTGEDGNLQLGDAGEAFRATHVAAAEQTRAVRDRIGALSGLLKGTADKDLASVLSTFFEGNKQLEGTELAAVYGAWNALRERRAAQPGDPTIAQAEEKLRANLKQYVVRMEETLKEDGTTGVRTEQLLQRGYKGVSDSLFAHLENHAENPAVASDPAVKAFLAEYGKLRENPEAGIDREMALAQLAKRALNALPERKKWLEYVNAEGAWSAALGKLDPAALEAVDGKLAKVAEQERELQAQLARLRRSRQKLPTPDPMAGRTQFVELEALTTLAKTPGAQMLLGKSVVPIDARTLATIRSRYPSRLDKLAWMKDLYADDASAAGVGDLSVGGRGKSLPIDPDGKWVTFYTPDGKFVRLSMDSVLAIEKDRPEIARGLTRNMDPMTLARASGDEKRVQDVQQLLLARGLTTVGTQEIALDIGGGRKMLVPADEVRKLVESNPTMAAYLLSPNGVRFSDTSMMLPIEPVKDRSQALQSAALSRFILANPGASRNDPKERIPVFGAGSTDPQMAALLTQLQGRVQKTVVLSDGSNAGPVLIQVDEGTGKLTLGDNAGLRLDRPVDDRTLFVPGNETRYGTPIHLHQRDGKVVVDPRVLQVLLSKQGEGLAVADMRGLKGAWNGVDNPQALIRMLDGSISGRAPRGMQLASTVNGQVLWPGRRPQALSTIGGVLPYHDRGTFPANPFLRPDNPFGLIDLTRPSYSSPSLPIRSGSEFLRPQYGVVDYEKKEKALADQLAALQAQRTALQDEKREVQTARAEFGKLIGQNGKPGDVDHFLKNQDKAEVLRWVSTAYQQGAMTGRDPETLDELRAKGIRYYHGVDPERALPHEVKQLETLAGTVPPAGSDNTDAWLASSASRLADIRNPLLLTEGGAERFLDLRARRAKGQTLNGEQLAFLAAWEGEGSYTAHLQAGLSELEKGQASLPTKIAEHRKYAAFARTLEGDPPAGFFEAMNFTPEQARTFRDNLRSMRAAPANDPNAAAFRASVRESVAAPIESWLSSSESYLARAPQDAARIRATLSGLAGDKDSVPPTPQSILASLKGAGYTVYDERFLRERHAEGPEALRDSLAGIAAQQKEHRLNQLLFNAVAEDEARLSRVFTAGARARMKRDGANPVLAGLASAYEKRQSASAAWTAFQMDPADKRVARSFAGVQGAETRLLNTTAAAMKDFKALDKDKRYFFWQRETDRNDAWFSHHDSRAGADAVVKGLGKRQAGETLAGLRLDDFDGGTSQFTATDSDGRQVIQQTSSAMVPVDGKSYAVRLDPETGERVLTDAKGGRFVVGGAGKLVAWKGDASKLVEQFEFTEHRTDASGDLKLRHVATYQQSGSRREKARKTLRDGMELLTRTLYGDGSIDITDVRGGSHVLVDTKRNHYTTTFLEKDGETKEWGRDRSHRIEKGDYFAGRYFATDKFSIRDSKIYHERNMGSRVWAVFEQERGGSGVVGSRDLARLNAGADISKLGFRDVRKPENYSYDLRGWEGLSERERLLEARAMSARTAQLGRLRGDTKDLMTGYILRNANKDETDYRGRKIDPDQYNVTISFTLDGDQGPSFRSDYFAVRDGSGKPIDARWMFSTNGRFLEKNLTKDRSGIGEFFLGDDYDYQQQIMTTPSTTAQGSADDVRRAEQLGDKASADLQRRAKRYDPKKWREAELEMSKVLSDVLQSHYGRRNGMLVSKQFGKFGDAEVVGVIAGESKYLRIGTADDTRGFINLTKSRYLYDDEKQVPIYEYYSAGMGGAVPVDTGRKRAWSRRLPDRYVFESDIIEDTGYYWEDWARDNPKVARGVAWAAAPIPMGIAALTGHSPSDEQLAAIYGGAAKGFVRFAPEVVTVLIPFGAAVKAVKWGLTAANMARTAKVAVTAIHVTFGVMMVPGLVHAGGKVVEAARTGDPDAIKDAVDEGMYWSLMLVATPKIFKMADGMGKFGGPKNLKAPTAPRAPPPAPKGFGARAKGVILKPFKAIANSYRAQQAAKTAPKQPGLAARGDALAQSAGQYVAQTRIGKVTGFLDKWMYLPEVAARGVGNLGHRDWRGRRQPPQFNAKGELVNPSRIGRALDGFANGYGRAASWLVEPKKPPLVQNTVELRDALGKAGIDVNAPAGKGLPTFTTARLYSVFDPKTGARGALSAKPPKPGSGQKLMHLDIFWRNGTKNFEVSNMNLGGAKLSAGAQLQLSASLLQWRGPKQLTTYELLGHAQHRIHPHTKGNRATIEVLYDANTGQAVKIVETGKVPEGFRGKNFRRTSIDVVFKDGVPELAFQGKNPPPFFEAMRNDLALRQQVYREGLGGAYDVAGASPKALAEYAFQRAQAEKAGAPRLVPDVVEGNFCHLSGTAVKLNSPALTAQRQALLRSLGRDPNGKVSTYDLIQVVEGEMGAKLGKAMTQKILEHGLEPRELAMVSRMIETRINKVSKEGVTFTTSKIQSSLSSPEAFAKAAPEGSLTVGLVSPDGPHVVTVKRVVKGKDGKMSVVFEDPVTPGKLVTLSQQAFFELARLDAFRLQAGKGQAPAWQSRAKGYAKDMGAFRENMQTNLALDGYLGKKAYDGLPAEMREQGFGAGWFGKRNRAPERKVVEEPVRDNGGFQRSYFEPGGPKAAPVQPGQLQNLRPMKVSSAHSNVYLAEIVVDGKPRTVVVKDNAVPNEIPTNMKAFEVSRRLAERGEWPEGVKIPRVYAAERWGPNTRAGLKSDAIKPERAAELAKGEKFLMVQEKIPDSAVSLFDLANGKANLGKIPNEVMQRAHRAVRKLNENGVGHNDFANGTNIMLAKLPNGKFEIYLLDFGQGTHAGVKARLQYDGNQVLGRFRELQQKGLLEGEVPPPKVDGFGAGNPAMEVVSVFQRSAEVKGREMRRGEGGLPPIESLFGKIPGLETAKFKGSTENGVSGDTVQIEIGGKPWFLKRVSKEIGAQGDQAIRAMSPQTRALNEAGMARVMRSNPVLSQSFKVTEQAHIFESGGHTFVLTKGVDAAPTMKTASKGMTPVERADASIAQLILGLGDMNRGNVLKGRDGKHALIDFEKISREPQTKANLQRIDQEIMLKNFPLVDRLKANDPAVYRQRFETFKMDYQRGGRARMEAALAESGWTKADRMAYLATVDKNIASYQANLAPYLEYANGWAKKIAEAKAEKARQAQIEAAKPKGFFSGLFGGSKGFGAGKKSPWVQAAEQQIIAEAKARNIPPQTLAKAVGSYLGEAFPKSEGVRPSEVIPASALRGQIKLWLENGNLERHLKKAQEAPARVPGTQTPGRGNPGSPPMPKMPEVRLPENFKPGDMTATFKVTLEDGSVAYLKTPHYTGTASRVPLETANAGMRSEGGNVMEVTSALKTAFKGTPLEGRVALPEVLGYGKIDANISRSLFRNREVRTHGGSEGLLLKSMPGRTLESHLDFNTGSFKTKNGRPGMSAVQYMALERQVRTMHELGYAHGDVHMGNIMLEASTIKKTGRVGLIDFGSLTRRGSEKFHSVVESDLRALAELRAAMVQDGFLPKDTPTGLRGGFGAGRSGQRRGIDTAGRDKVNLRVDQFQSKFKRAKVGSNDLIHFTDEAALAGILESGKILPSIDPGRGRGKGPSNAVHGDGVYFARGKNNALYHLDKDGRATLQWTHRQSGKVSQPVAIRVKPGSGVRTGKDGPDGVPVNGSAKYSAQDLAFLYQRLDPAVKGKMTPKQFLAYVQKENVRGIPIQALERFDPKSGNWVPLESTMGRIKRALGFGAEQKGRGPLRPEEVPAGALQPKAMETFFSDRMIAEREGVARQLKEMQAGVDDGIFFVGDHAGKTDAIGNARKMKAEFEAKGEKVLIVSGHGGPRVEGSKMMGTHLLDRNGEPVRWFADNPWGGLEFVDVMRRAGVKVDGYDRIVFATCHGGTACGVSNAVKVPVVGTVKEGALHYSSNLVRNQETGFTYGMFLEDPAATKMYRGGQEVGFGSAGSKGSPFDLGRDLGARLRGEVPKDAVIGHLPKATTLARLAADPAFELTIPNAAKYARGNRNLDLMLKAYRGALDSGEPVIARALLDGIEGVMKEGAYQKVYEPKTFTQLRERLSAFDDAPNPLKHWDASAYRHVFIGEYLENGAAIKGGVHTTAAMDGFLAKSGVSALARTTLDNGVVRVTLPTSAFTKNQLYQMSALARENPGYRVGTKTLFPESWSQAKIIDAVNQLKASGKFEPTRRGRRYEGVVDGVKIRILTGKDGTVYSAYPSPFQPGQ